MPLVNLWSLHDQKADLDFHYCDLLSDAPIGRLKGRSNTTRSGMLSGHCVGVASSKKMILMKLRSITDLFLNH